MANYLLGQRTFMIKDKHSLLLGCLIYISIALYTFPLTYTINPWTNLKTPLSVSNEIEKQHKYQVKKETKLILIWKNYSQSRIKKFRLADKTGNNSMAFCPFKCDYTFDREFLNSSDAVVINGAIPKNKLIAWTTSNCKGFSVPSQRSRFALELSKYVRVDIYGKCVTLRCPTGFVNDYSQDPLDCHQYLASQYKFYLAFENSLCSEYITEKFFDSLRTGMVPIVFGAPKEDYLRLAPNGSFIHVQDFKTVQDLAQYLLFLDSNLEEYLKYFEWRKHFIAESLYLYQSTWCNLCKKLYKTNKHEFKSYENVIDWWFYKNTNSKLTLHPCRKLNLFSNGSFSIM